MGAFEIVLIVVCSLFVVAVIAASLIRKKKGKPNCDCCDGNCACCAYKKYEDALRKDKNEEGKAEPISIKTR